jgi:hypothetical protein
MRWTLMLALFSSCQDAATDQRFAEGITEEGSSSGTTSADVTEDLTKASVDSELAMQPAIVAGSFLTCQYSGDDLVCQANRDGVDLAKIVESAESMLVVCKGEDGEPVFTKLPVETATVEDKKIVMKGAKAAVGSMVGDAKAVMVGKKKATSHKEKTAQKKEKNEIVEEKKMTGNTQEEENSAAAASEKVVKRADKIREEIKKDLPEAFKKVIDSVTNKEPTKDEEDDEGLKAAWEKISKSMQSKHQDKQTKKDKPTKKPKRTANQDR